MNDETSSSRDESCLVATERSGEERRTGKESGANVSVPNEDHPWSVHDVLSEMTAG